MPQRSSNEWRPFEGVQLLWCRLYTVWRRVGCGLCYDVSRGEWLSSVLFLTQITHRDHSNPDGSVIEILCAIPLISISLWITLGIFRCSFSPFPDKMTSALSEEAPKSSMMVSEPLKHPNTSVPYPLQSFASSRDREPPSQSAPFRSNTYRTLVSSVCLPVCLFRWCLAAAVCWVLWVGNRESRRVGDDIKNWSFMLWLPGTSGKWPEELGVGRGRLCFSKRHPER